MFNCDCSRACDTCPITAGYCLSTGQPIDCSKCDQRPCEDGVAKVDLVYIDKDYPLYKVLLEEPWRSRVVSISVNGINVFSTVLEKMSEANHENAPAVSEALKAIRCPCCGRIITEGLYPDYRNNGGCIGKQLTCGDCIGLNDKAYWELKTQKPLDKINRVIEFLKSGNKEGNLVQFNIGEAV